MTAPTPSTPPGVVPPAEPNDDLVVVLTRAAANARFFAGRATIQPYQGISESDAARLLALASLVKAYREAAELLDAALERIGPPTSDLDARPYRDTYKERGVEDRAAQALLLCLRGAPTPTETQNTREGGVMPQYCVILQSIVGGPDTGYTTAYGWDGELFDDKKVARSHGFKLRESDDFNIGHVEDGQLVGFYWMDRPLDYSLAEIAEAIGLIAPNDDKGGTTDGD